MLYKIQVSTPMTFRGFLEINCDRSEEDEFSLYVARIPVVGEKLSFERKNNKGKISYTYEVLKVDINCYLQAQDRIEHTSTDANVTALLISATDQSDLELR